MSNPSLPPSDLDESYLSHKVKPIDQPIIWFGYNVVDIILGGITFVATTQFLSLSIPNIPGGRFIAFAIGLAAGYGFLSAGQYLREYAPPGLVPYYMYWLRSGDRYVIRNDTYPMPLVPTDLVRDTRVKVDRS